jgi:hypothetical protein
MVKYKSTRQYRSRLARQESKRMKRQTLILIIITVIISLLLVTIGIPLLIKMAIVISEIGAPDPTDISQDAIPPQTPQLASPPEATNSAKLNITGVSEPGATVTLYQNNQERSKTVVDANGNFEFLDITLDVGNNTFYSIAKDSAGNESSRSSIRTVSYDTNAPTLGIEQPEDGAYISGATKQLTQFAGTTEVGAKVSLNERLLVVKSDGSFSGQHALNEGENKLTFVSTDRAGNQSAVTITVTYSKE